MLELILSVVVVLMFIVVVGLVLFVPNGRQNKILLLFTADCRNSCEDMEIVIKRAIEGEIIELNFLGQQK